MSLDDASGAGRANLDALLCLDEAYGDYDDEDYGSGDYDDDGYSSASDDCPPLVRPSRVTATFDPFYYLSTPCVLPALWFAFVYGDRSLAAEVVWADWYDDRARGFYNGVHLDLLNEPDQTCLHGQLGFSRLHLAATDPQPRWEGPPFPMLIDWLNDPTPLCPSFDDGLTIPGCAHCQGILNFSLLPDSSPPLSKPYWVPGPPGGPPRIIRSVLLQEWTDPTTGDIWRGPAYDKDTGIAPFIHSAVSSKRRKRNRHSAAGAASAAAGPSPP
eukprot:CAMPEP_0173387428 /NCGR_PEP_ID=MMETSP1356-20130122/9934_1 /TAXON_ID=77927 ORGANISM="Hemiselmis virescens, Strain PCC157" /NCGR_SAMPLE_ID=MMETSP1356 /ASSEMBLY_ACC=CAM_ASM_000847 /LENGTH=270 /DNA_ID=CAMNT_0014344047 /DNA_START=39 /DNA_END=851 /DNA_ORIENTATION=+